MTRKTFIDLCRGLDDCAYDVLTGKGDEYSGRTDAFGNFKRIGRDLNQPPELVALIYLRKHLDSIATAITEQSYDRMAEPFRDRIIDSINYLRLIYGMFCEKTAEPVYYHGRLVPPHPAPTRVEPFEDETPPTKELLDRIEGEDPR